MKRFRILETHQVEVWTYVWAKDKEEAKKKLEDGKGETEWDDPEDTDYQDTDWDTFAQHGEECTHDGSCSKFRCYRCGAMIGAPK